MKFENQSGGVIEVPDGDDRFTDLIRNLRDNPAYSLMVTRAKPGPKPGSPRRRRSTPISLEK